MTIYYRFFSDLDGLFEETDINFGMFHAMHHRGIVLPLRAINCDIRENCRFSQWNTQPHNTIPGSSIHKANFHPHGGQSYGYQYRS